MKPEIPLRGDRVLIRRFRDDDAAAFQAYRSDPEIARYQSWDADFSLDDARRFVSSVSAAPLVVAGEWIQLAIDLDGDLAGDVGIGFRDDPSVVEIGFTLAAAFHGHGFATEALFVVLVWLRSVGVETVLAIVDERNRPSRRVVERIGMVEVSRADAMFKGERCVEITYGLGL